ncbi:multidrug resistance protein B, drug resistance transporter [Staphylococcus aureus M1423]|jgi:EmrB/QacA subfamily drug resistance transporter|uniref:Quinolone resistance protein NorB n=17 Tax=Staphylococcus TaxID=1279 RepID=Q9F0Z1_STAAU|nr:MULTISPECIES: DHA2 family efflux MFS transporter permease subunit [Staphylococcus]ENK63230.1 drug:H+ antiporter-2 (14 Spanner) (DHA2) family drug resistance MFS transporter [Staphylococcus aureus M0562]EUY48388.1 multidrug resistance protein B, drug resistance transporter [Staphylococcus aureus M0406]HAR4217679.1 DHA2 family efflux MFS transporter permease subunit [Staphylococcus aureus ADL-227]HAR4239001.1 DHA2 family efflux MFS transporter permease subunit [Staphylococcus aureus ADL-330]H
MTTTFIISYIILALIIVGVINLFLIRSRKKGKRQQKEQQFTTRQSNQSKFKASDLDKTTDQSTQRMTHEELRVDNQDDHSQVSLNGYTKGSEKDQEAFTNNNGEEAVAAKNPESEEYKVNEKIKKEHKNFIFGEGVSRGKILAALLFGMFIAILNQTLLNVALPKINTEFNISASTGQWLMTGFMLVNGILIPITAYLFNKYSYRKLFLVALVLFTIGSLICAISMNFPIMMVGRVLQAIGAGVLMPLGSIVIITIYPPEKRGAAMGTMGIAMILAPAIGPTLSGYIVQNYHWNVMFYGMFIIGIIAILVGFVWFKLYQYTTNPKADIPGIIFSTIGFGALLYGFSEAGNKGWGSVEIETMFAIGIIFIILFVIRELRMKSPMLNLEVLKFPTFTLTTIINMVVMLSLYGGMILLPIYLQNLRGFSALDSGLLLLPGSLIMGLLGPFAGKLLDTIGLKPLAIFGIAVMTYATWELTKLNMDTPYMTIMGIYVLRSFGMAFIMMPMVTAAINALPGRLASHGNAFLNTMRQLAGSIGTAILVTVMTTQTTQHLSAFGEELDKTNPVVQDHMRELASQYGGQEGAMKVLLQFVNKLATVEGINDAFIVATIFSIIALILCLFLQSNKKAKATAQKLEASSNNNHE